MFEKLIKKIAMQLNKFEIPYMIIGGQAMLLYGEPRLTKDIDITLGIGIEEQKKIIQLVNSLKLKILVDDIEEFVKKTMVLPVIEKKSGIKIDFIFSFSSYERGAIERAVNVKFGKTIIKFASLEDIIIHKVIAGRARDIEDIKSILLKNTNYDKKYIVKWLKEFDKSFGGHFLHLFKNSIREIK